MPSKPPDYKYCQGRGRVLPTEILAPYELLNEGRLLLGCIDAAADNDFLRDHEAGAATGGGGSPYPRRHIHTYMCGDMPLPVLPQVTLSVCCIPKRQDLRVGEQCLPDFSRLRLIATGVRWLHFPMGVEPLQLSIMVCVSGTSIWAFRVSVERMR